MNTAIHQLDISNEETYTAFLRERRAQVMRSIENACARAKRSSHDVQLCAVSKTLPAHALSCALRAGYRFFGENRAQELEAKTQELQRLGALSEDDELVLALRDDVRFDMIGTLQTNKLNKVISCASRVQSLASLDMARALDRRCAMHVCMMSVLLEVNVSGEASKSGFAPDEVRNQFEALLECTQLKIEGLMAMAPAHDSMAAHTTFQGLYDLQHELQAQYGVSMPQLSCGMSDDFAIAIEHGSTLVRLGRILFDPNYPMHVLLKD